MPFSSGSYELGVKFHADVAGTVTGVRFYKQSWMGGYTHAGHLWTATGTLLASATFTNETASGWEQVNFSRPVSIAANTVYIVSFSTGGGYFGITSNYFSGAGVDNGPLHALSNGVSGGDGVYHSGNGSFPSVSGSGMNFWADVVFSPTSTSQVVVRNATTTSSPAVGSATPAFAAPSAAVSQVAATSTIPSVSSKNAVATPSDSWPYRRVVAQALTLSSARGKWAF